MNRTAILLTSFLPMVSMSAISESKPLELTPDFCSSAFTNLMGQRVLALDVRPTNSSAEEVTVVMHYQNEENFPEDAVGKCKMVDGNIVILPPVVTYKYKR